MLVNFEEISALVQVILVDLALAGDNAIVIALFASTVPAEMRRRVIIFGIAFAALTRIVFALVTVQLLAIPGLTFVGGMLLLWVCWSLGQTIRGDPKDDATAHQSVAPSSTLARKAITQIIIADLSMSLDNVIAVAGVARDHPVVLIIGLALSIALMAVGAHVMARLLVRQRWIGVVGLAIILFVSYQLLRDGSIEIIGILGQQTN